jgi:hypothetical protein
MPTLIDQDGALIDVCLIASVEQADPFRLVLNDGNLVVLTAVGRSFYSAPKPNAAVRETRGKPGTASVVPLGFRDAIKGTDNRIRYHPTFELNYCSDPEDERRLTGAS